MSKLNPSVKPLSPFATRELGLSGNGNVQFVKAPLQALFELVTGAIYGKDTMYESSSDRVQRLRQALVDVVKASGVEGVDAAARIAVFTRHKIGMRTMSIIMGVELLKVAREQNVKFEHGRKFISLLIDRADELLDLYAYALTVFGEKGKVPLAIKRGVADAFNKFDGYQLAKYNRTDGKVTLKRLLRVVHPTPANEIQSQLFAQLMTDTLPSPDTWEVALSTNGMLPKDQQLSKKDLWTKLVSIRGKGEMGYMALIRNLRNIAQADVAPDVLKGIAARISDPQAVAKSRMLPWAFINAYDVAVAEKLPAVLKNAVGQAIEHSLGNLPLIGERVWLIGDVSGSMGGTYLRINNDGASSLAGNTPVKVMAILMAALFKAQKAEVALTLFSDNAELLQGLNPLDSVISLYSQIIKKSYGGGTNIEAAFRLKPKLGFEPDTVIVLSDMEVNPMSGFSGLSVTGAGNLFKKDTMKIAFNLNASETTPLDPRDGWLQLAGWSEKVFQYVDMKRNGQTLLENIITGQIEIVNYRKPKAEAAA